MIKLSEKSRRLLRMIYRGLGVTAVSFLLPACPVPEYGAPSATMYGMPPYQREDILIQGQVKSKKTGEPIPRIGIWIKDVNTYWVDLTGFDGSFYIYVPKQDNYTIVFTDVDGSENGGPFKQYTVDLTMEQCEALGETPLIIALEEVNDLFIQGQVKSKKTGEPIPGIGIWIKDVTSSSAFLTENDGSFSIYVPKQDDYTVVFTDIDRGENGLFKQHTANLTKEQCEALRETPLIIELEEVDAE